MINNEEPTITDVLLAINDFSAKTDERFNRLENNVASIINDVEGIKTSMVTKDYLDDKMSDLRGDLVVMMRKEDNKLKTLVEILTQKNILTSSDSNKILLMEPFAGVII